MPEDPNFSQDIVVTGDSQVIKQVSRDTNISQKDTVKLKENLEKVFADILKALIKDMSIPQQEALEKYNKATLARTKAERLLREANNTNTRKDDRIGTLKLHISDLNTQISDTEAQAKLDVNSAKEVKDLYYNERLSKKDEEIRSKNNQI